MPNPFRGVTVEVISEGGKLNFYPDPDEDPSDLSPRTRQQYVEAVTGSIFKVRILLADTFPLYSLRLDDGVRLLINYDGQQPAWYTDLSAREIELSWARGQPAEHTFARVSRYCNDSQRWTTGETTFGALRTSGLPLFAPLTWKYSSNRMYRRHGSFGSQSKRSWPDKGDNPPRLQDQEGRTHSCPDRQIGKASR